MIKQCDVNSMLSGRILPGSAGLVTGVLTLSGNDAHWEVCEQQDKQGFA